MRLELGGMFKCARSNWQQLMFVVLLSSAFMVQAYDEIQVYDMSINQPGQFALEMHSNYVIRGRQQPNYPGELPSDGTLAFTPEFSYGLSHHVELGLYLPMSINPATGDTFLDDAKLRVKLMQADDPELFYGLNMEVGMMPRRYSEQLLAMEIRPIFGHYSGDWLISLNPNLELDLTGPRQMPVLSPGLKVTHLVADKVHIGIEHYADFGDLNHFAPGREQGHTTYLVTDVSHGAYRLHVGIGHGWTGPSDAWMLKVIVGGIPFTEILNPNRW